MLESVGKLADRQCQQQQQEGSQPGSSDAQDHSQDSKYEEFNTNLYFEHLKEIASKVSNRVRFLILNVTELRDVRFYLFSCRTLR